MRVSLEIFLIVERFRTVSCLLMLDISFFIMKYLGNS